MYFSFNIVCYSIQLNIFRKKQERKSVRCDKSCRLPLYIPDAIPDLDLVFRTSSLAFPLFSCAINTGHYLRKSLFLTLLDTLKFIIKKYF